MSKRLLYVLAGAIVLVLILIAVGVFVVLPSLNSANSGQAAMATPTASVSATPTPKPNPLALALKQYGPNIKSQIAQGLHLSSDQLLTQMKSGKTLNDVATAQGVSATQLQTIVHDAIENGLKPAVDGGTVRQKQVDNLVKRYQNNPTQLDRFLGAPARPKKA